MSKQINMNGKDMKKRLMPQRIASICMALVLAAGITGCGVLMIYGFSLLSFLENQFIRWIKEKIHKEE